VVQQISYYGHEWYNVLLVASEQLIVDTPQRHQTNKNPLASRLDRHAMLCGIKI